MTALSGHCDREAKPWREAIWHYIYSHTSILPRQEGGDINNN